MEYSKKENLAKQIQNVKNVDDLKKIEELIKKHNPKLEIKVGESEQLVPFHKLSKITYEKLDILLKRLGERPPKKLRIRVKIDRHSTRINIVQVLNDNLVLNFD